MAVRLLDGSICLYFAYAPAHANTCLQRHVHTHLAHTARGGRLERMAGIHMPTHMSVHMSAHMSCTPATRQAMRPSDMGFVFHLALLEYAVQLLEVHDHLPET